MYLFAGNVIVSMLIMGYYVCLLLSVEDSVVKVGGAKKKEDTTICEECAR